MPTTFADRDAELIPPGDLAACRARLSAGSRSFDLAGRLLPRRVRDPAAALYAFCRLADDAIDHGRGDAAARVRALRSRLDAIYAGRAADDPADRALAATVQRCSIPRALPEALLEGLEWDAAGRRYHSYCELRGYAARVAGSVGVMMALVMGVRERVLLARAADLGVAMQLTNIARDVGEDARVGRLYLPLDRLVAAGIDPDAWLAQPVAGDALAGVVTELLAEADELYRRAGPGIVRLPALCRPAIHAAGLIYADIGREITRRGSDPVTARAVVPARRKAALSIRALAPPAGRGLDPAAAPLDETAFLLDAVPATAAAGPTDVQAMPWWDLRGRLVWTIDLFLRLHERQRLDSEAHEASK